MIAVYPGDIIPERWAKSSRNDERHQIGLAGDIIPDSRATSPGLSNLFSRCEGWRPKSLRRRNPRGLVRRSRSMGFDWAVAWAGDAVAGVGEGKLALAVANWSSLLRSTS